MSLDLHSVFTGGAEAVCSSPLFNRIVQNPVTVSLVITVIVLAIVCACHRAAADEVSYAKMGVWVLFGVSAMVFVHYYALRRSLQRTSTSEGLRTAATAIHQAAAVGGGYAVAPLTRPPQPHTPQPHTRTSDRHTIGAASPHQQARSVTFAAPLATTQHMGGAISSSESSSAAEEDADDDIVTAELPSW